MSNAVIKDVPYLAEVGGWDSPVGSSLWTYSGCNQLGGKLQQEPHVHEDLGELWSLFLSRRASELLLLF